MLDSARIEVLYVSEGIRRIDMYSDSTRIRALQLLIGQIASRNTGHLIQALLAWPEVEINLLLSEILACLDPIR